MSRPWHLCRRAISLWVHRGTRQLKFGRLQRVIASRHSSVIGNGWEWHESVLVVNSLQVAPMIRLLGFGPLPPRTQRYLFFSWFTSFCFLKKHEHFFLNLKRKILKLKKEILNFKKEIRRNKSGNFDRKTVKYVNYTI